MLPAMLSKKQLRHRVCEGEGLFQEFKTSLAKIDRTLVAFANARGGVIYLGVDDTGKRKGFSLSNRTRAQIEDIAKNLDPPVPITCMELGKIAAIVVAEGEEKPYRCADGFFLRVGASNQKLSRNDILDLAVRMNRLHYESLQELSFRYPQDFSEPAFRNFVQETHLDNVLKSMGREDFLNSLGVAEQQAGRLIFNHVGILFFAKKPQQFLPQAKLNYARYQGTTKTHVVDRILLSGTILEQLAQVSRKLAFDIPVRYQLADQQQRQEIAHYPLRALEEAVINALVHRDYYERGAEVMIDYYSDRIEISNPGELLGSLQVKNLGTRAIRRNPLIAELFYRLGRGEKLGSGIARMRALMGEWKLKPPHFGIGPWFFFSNVYWSAVAHCRRKTAASVTSPTQVC